MKKVDQRQPRNTACEPEKLIAAIKLALLFNPDPSESDFAAAANKVAPLPIQKKQSILGTNGDKIPEPLVPKKALVTIASPEHPRYGEPLAVLAVPVVSASGSDEGASGKVANPKGQEGVIVADAPNNSQQIVTFSDSERLLVNNADINDTIASESSQRTYPALIGKKVNLSNTSHPPKPPTALPTLMSLTPFGTK